MSSDMMALVTTLAAYYAANYTEAPVINPADLPTDKYWGPGNAPAVQDTSIRCARVVFEETMVQDLKQRLEQTRINYQPYEGAGFFYGFNGVTLSNWTNYWLNEYDFEEGEASWNKYPGYITNVNGLDVFYYRIQPKTDSTKEVVPLMILHGWPGSPMEFFDLVQNMTAVSEDRDFVIDLILPAIPGFGFSEAAAKPGFDPMEVAIVLRNLMHRIGYKKFYIQGGDAAAIVLGLMATRFPDEVLGYHTNWGVLLSPVAMFLQMVGQLYPSLVVSNETSTRMYPIETVFSNLLYGTGYMHVHAPTPDTLGISMTDSPVGLLGCMLEKWSGFESSANYALDDGGLFTSYTQKFIIDNLMYYWSTKHITGSLRLYADFMNKAYFGKRYEEIVTPVPTWQLAALEEISYQSPLILRLKYRNLLGSTVLTKGGHFIAHQFPEDFTNDVFKAITVFREWHVANGTDTSVV